MGCTVHLIDSGIDTGSILARREVDSTGCHSITSLRGAVDDTQLALLGTVVGLIIDGKTLTASEPPGRQYFYMHDNLLAILAARLSKNPPAMLRRGAAGENRRILAGSVTHADH